VKFEIEAGPYLRELAPVKIPLQNNVDVEPSGAQVVLAEPCDEMLKGIERLSVGDVVGVKCAMVKDGRSTIILPMQVEREGDMLYGTLIIPRIEPNKSITVELVDKSEGCIAHPVSLRHLEDEKRVDVEIGGELFTAYRYSEKYVRPFLYPLIGPFGQHLTREVDVEASEGFDHIHHRSLYTAWGDINSVNVWSEEGAHGYMRHHCFGSLVSGDVYGRICAHITWTDHYGKPLMEQIAVYQFYGTPQSHRLIDMVVAFHAKYGPVRFGDTKEGGIVSIRVFPTMAVVNGGRLENSYGAVNEAHVWGKRAHWCDYSGPVNGVWVGVAIFDNQRNLRHPTYWHARDYGLMTANPFGLSEFLGRGHDGSYVLGEGDWLVFRYRVYAHIGDASVGRVGLHYINYVAPPSFKPV
jgi:hypothetical protein